MTYYGKFFIDGAWVEPLSSTPFDLVNPATEAVFGSVALGSAEDVDRAVAAARSAFGVFGAYDVAQRRALLERVIAVYERRQDDLMAALTIELGVPVSLRRQVDSGLASLRQALATLEGYAFERREGATIVRHEPIGVAGLITPWNWPVQLACNKLGSAFAAGCPVVLKPSEFTPVSSIILAEIIEEAGAPPGAFNLVNGDGPVVGHAIAAHPDIDIVSFTGSTRAGILVAEAAAQSVKRVTQELGGKSANIVLPGADLAAAAAFNVSRGYANSGQSCHSPTRILVHEAERDALLDHLTRAVASVVVGDPTDPATTHGPVVNRAQFDRIQHYIQTGLDEGGRLVTGGPGRPEGLTRGFFIRPTIFADVTPDMTIAREEIFGMVTSVMTYSTVDEAAGIANATEYGLGGYVFGPDPDEGLEVCRRIRAGRVSFGGASPEVSSPMGGYRRSGNGREMGAYGLEEYLEVKAISGF